MNQSVMKIGKSMFSKTGNLISGVKKSIQKSKTIKKGTSKIKSVFEKKRLERQKRMQKEQNLENKDNPTIPQKNRKIEPKKFGSNILSAIKKLLLGWLVIQIPKIIESIKVIIDKIKGFVDFIKNIIPNIKKFIGNLFKPFKKLDDDIVNLDLKSGEEQVKQEIDNFETETKNTIGEFDPEEKKQLDEEEQKKDTEQVQLTTKKETISTKKEVSGRLDMDTGKTYINEKEVSADEYNTFQNMSMTEKIQNYGQTESFESTDSNLLNEEGGLNISLENFKDNTPDASSLQQADSREGNLSVNNISKTLEIDKSVVNNKNMTTVNNINQFRKQKRKTVVINSNNQNNNNTSNNMMQTKSSSNVVVVKEKSKKIDDLLFSKLGDL